MNFAYGVIAIVGVLAAIILGLIADSPDDIVEPRIIPVEEISVNSYIMPKTVTVGDVLLIEVEFRDDDKNIVDHVNYDISATQDGDTILLESGSHRHPGKHPIHETIELGESQLEIQVILQGLGHGDEISGPKGTITTMTVVPEPESESTPLTSTVPAPPVTHTVEVPEGSGAPGCDATDECFVPYSLQVRVGDTVIWNNVDTAAHTVTSGNISDGVDGVFDSSLFMSGTTFEFTFDEAGEYPYFCMVHPWMTGEVVVNEIKEMLVVLEPTAVIEPEATDVVEIEETITISESPPLTEPEPEREAETLPMTLTVSIPEGVGVLGCEETNECYSPYELSVAVGATVTWSNDDVAVHTVTSGKKVIHDGLFDSSIFMSGTTFEFTFDDVGDYDYFCLVHPWMTGIVHVS